MSLPGRFFRFWYSFLIGDDWLSAAGLLLALGATALLAHRAVSAWWLMPAAVALLLAWSLRRLMRRAA